VGFPLQRKLKINFDNFKMINQRKIKPFPYGDGDVALDSEGVDVQRGLEFWAVQ
jgi:hypothetical protein